MKRSHLLSALLLGLSMTVAGSALAHPGDEVNPRADKPEPPPPPPPPAAPPADPTPPPPADPQPTPADGTTPPAQPTPVDPNAPLVDPNAPPPPDPNALPPPATLPPITIGTPVAGPPAADTPQSAATQAPAAPKRRSWAGSSLFISNSMTTGTVIKGQTLYNDPTVESAFYLTPRYAINEAWQIRARIVFSYEWTNNDENTYAHEPTLSDTTLSLYYRKIPSFYGIQPYVGGNLTFPTSKPSRARTLIVSPGITGQLVRGFEHFLGGELDLIGALTYSHPIYESAAPEVTTDQPYAFNCLGGNGCGDLLGGTMNVSDILAYSFIASAEWGKWNPAFAYIGTSAWAYHPMAVANPIDGTQIHAPAGTYTTNLRQTHYLSLWLDYNFTPWITGEVGYWNAVSGIGPDGQRSNVIFDRYQDTRVYIGASIQLDNLEKLIEGQQEGAAGVVRAKNKSPMFTF